MKFLRAFGKALGVLAIGVAVFGAFLVFGHLVITLPFPYSAFLYFGTCMSVFLAWMTWSFYEKD